MSIRRACSALRIDRSLYVYKSKRGGQADLKQRIKEICATRVRYGYRRVHILLQRDGYAVNPKRIYRLYKEMGLQLRNKTPKRRVKAKLREDRAPATRPNDVWAMDFVHDQLATGRKIRVLTVVDTFSRFSPGFPEELMQDGSCVSRETPGRLSSSGHSWRASRCSLSRSLTSRRRRPSAHGTST